MTTGLLRCPRSRHYILCCSCRPAQRDATTPSGSTEF